MVTKSATFNTITAQRGLIFFSSSFLKFVVDGAKTLAQMNYRVVLARKQSIHAEGGLSGKFFEATALDFVGDEYLALLIGKLLQSIGKFLE
jgi:hypothetical protein